MRGERQRLLREAAHLREYLPKGMLRDMEDLHLVQETADQQQMQQGTGPPGGLLGLRGPYAAGCESSAVLAACSRPDLWNTSCLPRTSADAVRHRAAIMRRCCGQCLWPTPVRAACCMARTL